MCQGLTGIPENSSLLWRQWILIPALYTTNPRSGMGVETTDEAVVYRVFRLDGTCVMTGATQESLRELQRGMYIICSPHGAEKRMVR